MRISDWSSDVCSSDLPTDKEHHFRSNEQDHPITQVQLNHRRMITRVSLPNYIGPPAEHGEQDARDARQEDIAAARIFMQPHDAAHGHNKRRHGTDERQYAWRSNMIVVRLGSRSEERREGKESVSPG